MLARVRNLVSASLLLAFSLSLGACGGSAPPAAAPSADVPAPYPFTVAEIRAGCPLGRVVEYRVEKAGAPASVERWEFTPLDDQTVKVVTTDFDAAGNPSGAPQTETDKWTDLHEHGRFPQSATTISNESLSLPAGTFDVMKYVVTKGDTVKTVWFARTLPGPPVKLEIAKGGQVVMAMTMEANRSH
jgi:hypothetical protein